MPKYPYDLIMLLILIISFFIFLCLSKFLKRKECIEQSSPSCSPEIPLEFTGKDIKLVELIIEGETPYILKSLIINRIEYTYDDAVLITIVAIPKNKENVNNPKQEELNVQ